MHKEKYSADSEGDVVDARDGGDGGEGARARGGRVQLERQGPEAEQEGGEQHPGQAARYLLQSALFPTGSFAQEEAC